LAFALAVSDNAALRSFGAQSGSRFNGFARSDRPDLSVPAASRTVDPSGLRAVIPMILNPN
jgi:hypothetical protein